jgi:hypothetical protein
MQTSDALRSLLTGLIDYAGLFPPASLDLTTAMSNYAAYRASEHAWMLGRFVVPAAQAAEVDASWPLSVIAADKKSERAGDVEYIEIPVTSDPAGLGARAKIRTGGSTPDAYPSAAELAGFLHRAAAARVPFKATAGLHHALPSPPMHGFVNLFLAACLMWHGGSEADALATLEDRNFRFHDRAYWHYHRLTAGQIGDARAQFAISSGSCSFEEPVEDLTRLEWL